MMMKLGDIIQITSGGTPNKHNLEYYENGSIPWVKTGDLKNKYILEDVECITQFGLEKSSAKLFPAQTVLVAMYGATIGACSILPYEASTNQACAAFLPSDKVTSDYLYYFLCSKKEKFIQDGVGGAQPNISTGYLKNVRINLISIDEQKEITINLDKVTHTIDLCNQIIEKLDLFVKARFVEMFGEPILNPKGFPVYRMNEVVEFQGGSQPDKKFFEYEPTEDNIRLIQIRDYKTDKYITYIPKALAKRFCNSDDIMIGRYGPPIFQILQGIEGAFNVALMKATPLMGNKEFIRYFLKQDCLLHYLEGMSKRTAGQDGIQMDKLKAYPFPMPPLELQQKFADFVEQIDKSKSAVKQVLEKAETLKKALMQEYFE